eukprot:m.15952 g.15952  ORF g.15952 m.15952 type:complete len:277 (+) comp26643_c0_seq2:336-1166(+)
MSQKKFSRESIRERLEGNEVDLTLSELTTVPVKELLLFPQATSLDLSCNLLAELPDNFCSLTHLVKLDLSKNKLQCLPEAFGHLDQLQKLDLYSNQLVSLPLTFSKLSNLKWLDLKGNALEDELAAAAGPCSDDKECRQCAKQVSALMRGRSATVEKVKQKKLRALKAKEAALEEVERLKREEVKLQKVAERQKRREKYLAENTVQRQKEDTDGKEENTQEVKVEASDETPKINDGGGSSHCLFVLGVLLGLLSILMGVLLYCGRETKCQTLKSFL